MTLSDTYAYKQVIGCLMHHPVYLLEYDDLSPDDFDQKLLGFLYFMVTQLYKKGLEKINPLELDQEILRRNDRASMEYKSNDGLKLITNAYEMAEIINFPFYYNRIKKYALLRRLQKEHYDISDYYRNPIDLSPLDEIKLQEKIDESTLEEILDNVESKFDKIKNDFINKHGLQESPAEKIYELIEELEQSPNIGPNLEGEIFSGVCRGAREGCFFLKSSSSGTGKTRTAVFDACRICYPKRYSHYEQNFIQEYHPDGTPRSPRKVLFIVTEMDKEELQTIILAYLSGVDEGHIIAGRYEEGERARVLMAAQIMTEYKDYFFIDEISEPNLVNVASCIKKHATVDKVKFVMFDYIHTTASSVGEFEKSGLNEATILMLMANQLKQLAKDYNLFIFSATQVNMGAMSDDGSFKNETNIRSSKAIADKADVAYVMSRVGEKTWNEILVDLRKMVQIGKLDSRFINDVRFRPTHVLDIYKMRRGRYKNVRIWIYLHLGTGERIDLFMTSADNTPVPFYEPLDTQTVIEKELEWGNDDGII